MGDRIVVTGEPERCVVGFVGPAPLIDKSFVQQSFAAGGIIFNGSMFICGRHSDDDIERTIGCLDQALATLGRTVDVLPLLEGPPVQPVFRKP